MPEMDSSVRALMGCLGGFDEILDHDIFSGSPGSVYEEIYMRLLESDCKDSNSHATASGTGHGFSIIPGNEEHPCTETLVVFLFPVFRDFHRHLYRDSGQEYQNHTMEIRMYQARKYAEACPSLRNIIFYGPEWDSVIWKIHKDNFSKYNVYLKLFFSAGTTLKK